MGVPKFFRWISERYPCLSELIKEYQIPEFDHLYLDMNGIIHNCSHPNDYDPHFRITEEKIFQDIFHYIEILFRMIQPKRLFFMAVDGVAPRAKQNQQRGRRFRSAKDAEVLEAKAMEKGECLPTAARFDSNCITPGTPFMVRLQEQLKFFVANKISTDDLWHNCTIILSGHETPGEGEHKIMDYIRYMKAQPDYDSNTRHCLYGLDADLIMLGLCSHEPHFSLLREEVRFDRKKQDRISSPEQTTFFLLHLSLMREYLEHEFAPVKAKLPPEFAYNAESIIDDWVLMGFLVGNDFIPPLPELHISNGALPMLYQTYMSVLPTLGGYINEQGTLNLKRFQRFMQELSKFDLNQFDEKFADLQYFQSKTGRRPGAKERTQYVKKSKDMTPEEQRLAAVQMAKSFGFGDELDTPLSEIAKEKNGPSVKPPAKAALDATLESGSGDASLDLFPVDQPLNADLAAFMSVGMSYVWSPDDDSLSEGDESGESLMMQEFRQHKRDYYINKLDYEDVTPEVLKRQAEGYVRAIQWNLNYYYNGVCSWSWFYPHHYSPYISDIREFADMTMEFDMGQPFLPFQQLAAVLPAASKEHLPSAYQWLMEDQASPIIHYYPKDFDTDLNGKRQEWEAVVLIPFIDETLLLSAMDSCADRLTLEEVSRNRHGPMSVFKYTSEDQGVLPSPSYFPSIAHNHAQETLVEREDVFVPRDKLVRGLCSDVRLDVYFPGFPTLKHIRHKGSLVKGKVKVFEQPSRGENLVLSIVAEPREPADVATDILGKTIYVQWPHLVEALVTRVATSDQCFELDPNGCIVQRVMTGSETGMWQQSRKAVAEVYLNRRGVKVGDTTVMVTARTMVGRKYVFGARDQSKITLEKQWAEVASTFALQATVRDIAVHDATFTQYRTLDEVFLAGSTCFVLVPKYYGLMGTVLTGAHSGRVKVTMTEQADPDLAAPMRLMGETRVPYMTGSTAGAKLGISSHLLSRITGNIFVLQSTSNSSRGANIALSLKFSKKNEEIPGFTRRDTNGTSWLYSQKAVELVNAYMEAFPELFEYLSVHTNKDDFEEEEMFPKQPGRVNEILAWLKTQPYAKVDRQACGSLVLEQEVVLAIEAALAVETNTMHRYTVQLRPALLYKPELHTGNLPPDPGTTFMLFDRVVNVRKGFTVPLGLRGVVIGIHKSEKEEEVLYDIVFDEEFVGGQALACSPNRGYRMPRSALINVSHCKRKEEGVQSSSVDASWSAFAPVERSRHRPAQVFNNAGLNSVPQLGVVPRPSHPMSWREKPAPAPAPTPAYTLLAKKQDMMSTPNQNYVAMWENLSNRLPDAPVPSLHPGPVKSAPQPSKSSEAEASNLMKLLKIEPDKKPIPAKPQNLSTQISVEDLFLAARESNPSPAKSYCAELLSQFQVLGLGMPRYTYVMEQSTERVRAVIELPGGVTFAGSYESNKEKAATHAAKLALDHLRTTAASRPPPPLLPTPPQQWCRQPALAQPQLYQPPPLRAQNVAHAQVNLNQSKPASVKPTRQVKQKPAPQTFTQFMPSFAQPIPAANQAQNGSSPRFVPQQSTQRLIRVTGPPVREPLLIPQLDTPVAVPIVTTQSDARPEPKTKPKRIAANFNFSKKAGKKTSANP